MQNYFKNIALYKTNAVKASEFEKFFSLEESTGLHFKNCSDLEVFSFGFNPRGPVQKLLDGNFVLNFKFGERKVLTAELKAKTDERLAACHRDSDGAGLTKAEIRAVKDSVFQELIPTTFERVTDGQLFYHQATGQLISNTPAHSHLMLGLVIKALTSLSTETLHLSGCAHSLTKNLEECIHSDVDYAIGRFGYGDKLDFKSTEGAEVKYRKEYDADQITAHIDAGYEITLVRLTSRGLSFDLTKDFKIGLLAFDKSLIGDASEDWTEFEDRADYETAVMSFQLDLVAEMGADLVKTFLDKAEEYRNA